MYPITLKKISDENNLLGWDKITIIGQRLSHTETRRVTPDDRPAYDWTMHQYEYIYIGDDKALTSMDACEFDEYATSCYEVA